MRILQVNKFLYRKAGAEAYLLSLAELLSEHGHEVTLWGTDHNAPLPAQAGQPPLILRGGGRELLVQYLNYDRKEGLWWDLKKFTHMIWSPEARWKFGKAIRKFRPEIIHVHNIYHQLSPSILRASGRYKIPVVMTVHDYHLINPNYTLYDHGAICGRHGLAAIFHRCVKNSFAASFADVLEWRLHRMMRVYERYVAKFLAPTEFVKEKLVKSGMDKGKIEVVKLPVGYLEADPPLQRRLGLPYILYAGRLVQEKGIYLILELAGRLPEIKFKIAGEGTERENVECKMKNEKLKNLELLGFVEKLALQKLIDGARLVLVPSLWYEPSPLAILEAMAQGKVVVASRIGGIPTLIEDGKTGFLATPKDLPEWIDTITKIYYDEALLKRVGKAAQAYVRRVHDPEKHYAEIMEIYRSSMR